MKKLKVSAMMLAACMAVCGLPVHVNAEKMEESSGGSQLEMMYEEKQAEVQAEMELLQQKAEAQQGANAAYAEIEEAMTVNPGAEENVYAEEYAGAYINDNNTLVVCVTAEDMGRDIDANVISQLSGEAARQAQDVMAGNIEYKVVEHSYNELAHIQDEIINTYEKLYPAYGEGTPEYELLSAITRIGLDEEKNVVTVGIDELSEQKINNFTSLFGEYDCLEFEECAPYQETETYYPGRGIFIRSRDSKGRLCIDNISIGFRCYRISSKGNKQYGYVTCGHGCKDSVDGYVYASRSSAENQTNPKGIICNPTFSGSVDASFIRRINKDIKIGAKTYYDAAGNKYGDNIKRNAYMGGIARGAVVYKCGAASYKTSGYVTNNSDRFCLDGVWYNNFVRVDSKFCIEGDSGGIVYTYSNNEYVPCGIISGRSGDKNPDVYGYFSKASEIAYFLNVTPF